ncbi:MAG: M50 family metallopeptidase [Ruminococcus sp.]|nr:M50 family metallopeptidase [Ruminococcus sp.]
MNDSLTKLRLSKDLNIESLSSGKYSVFVGSTKKSYVIGQNEYNIMCMLDECGSSSLINKKTGYYSEEQLEKLVQFFLKNGIAENGDVHKKRIVKDGFFKFKVSLLNGNKLFRSDSFMVKLFASIILYASLPVLIIGTILAFNNDSDVLKSVTHAFKNCPVYVYPILFFFLVMLHEAGHAIVTRSLKIPVSEIGLLIFIFYPVVYTNISFSRLLKKRRDRLKCLLAGIFTNHLITGASLAFIGIGANGIMRDILYVNAVINLLITLTNLIVFFKLDGYFILQDFIGIPMLYETSINSFISKLFTPVAYLRMRKAKKENVTISSLASGTFYNSESGGSYDLFYIVYGGLCFSYIPFMLLSFALTIINIRR